MRLLEDAKLLSNADRAMLHTYGVSGGKHGGNYGISIEAPDGVESTVPGMADNVPAPKGSVVRIKTTGGGGWGDPLAREPEKVAYDVECGLVTEAAARDDYGVVVQPNGVALTVDLPATQALRDEKRRHRNALPMFDRGPYFEAVKRDTGIARPADWQDPDDGWQASETPS